jgi:hypothetical protein
MTDQGGTRGHEAEGPIVEPADLVPDPLVEKLVPDPSQPPPSRGGAHGAIGQERQGEPLAPLLYQRS